MKSENIVLGAVILGLVLLGSGGIAVYTMTRGLRNNNPGNIDDDGTNWEGLSSPRNDGRFLIFSSPAYGIRAMARILSNYVAVDGVSPTVTDIITRWAPPSENDTASYIADVQQHMGLAPGSDSVNLSTDLPALVAAIIQHENGIQPYSGATIAQGIALA